MSEKQYQHLKSALASARMEGFVSDERIEHDCIRLLNGEISVTEIVKEIVNRTAGEVLSHGV